MNGKNMKNTGSSGKNGVLMPVLFLGHGSPMNAIEDNEFTTGFREAGKNIPRPKTVLCISAHWETRGTRITAMKNPPTIHDFGGFPERLYSVQYPAPGDQALAEVMKKLIKKTTSRLDEKWGLDHGCWSVLKHIYPDADVPVVQLSLDYNLDAKGHYELAKELRPLRKKGVLIVCSGNIVHNLRMLDWRKLNKIDYGYDWALEANEKVKKYILNEDHGNLIKIGSQGKVFQLAIPTPEHYLPLIYALAMKDDSEKICLFNDKAVGGSLTMTSVKIG